MQLNDNDFAHDLSRRKSGAKGTTARCESDFPDIVSGIFDGYTTGAPITILFKNENFRPIDYNIFAAHPRPGHVDFVALKKFAGFANLAGGGHFSGRLTLGIVVAGIIAKKIIVPVSIKAKILEIGGQTNINDAIEIAMNNGDSIGGIIECIASNLPVGLGEPFFNSIESVISHLIFSIPGIKGIEFGIGFGASKITGSLHNDCFIDETGATKTNNSGGINGGISNGNNLIFRVVVKPTASIAAHQSTYNFNSKKIEELVIKGRHDVCFALRIPPIIEAATAIVLADFMLQNQLIKRNFNIAIDDLIK